MKIFDKNNNEILDVAVDDSSVRYRAIMTDDSLTLNFALTGAIAVPQFSYCIFEGQRYTLWRPQEFKKINTRNREYTLVLHGWREFLKFVKFKDTSSKPHRLKFSLTAKPADFLRLLVGCLNLKDSGWSVGDCIDAPEKTLSFNHEFCIDALGRMAQEWQTEFEFEGKKVHLRKVEKFKDAPLALSYGKGNGFLPGVGRYNEGDKQPIGTLHVEGGERNIDRSKYGSKTLLLPKSATLVHAGKTYRTDADGMYITRDGNSLVGEDSYDGTHFYPHRIGTVSAVVTVNAAKNFYDIKDSSIPENLNYRDGRIKGEKAVIKFESGALAGREFDIEQTDKDLTGYIHAERRFRIVPAELDGVVMPGGAFVPKVGDKYAIFNIALPQAYISDNATKTGASWDMFRESVRFFSENENDRFRFSGELDGVWSRGKWLEIGGKITPGGHVLFSDEQFQPAGVVIRIVAVKDYVNKPHKPEITLSNAPISGSFSAGLAKLEADEVVIEESKREVIRYSQRQWRDARETMELLEKTMLNFSGSINPLTVQTMQLIAGDESLQFRFVNSKNNPARVGHVVHFNKSNAQLTAPAGILQHMTIGIKTLSNSHRAGEYKFWDMAAYTSPPLDPGTPYYLYAKCAKTGAGGTFGLSDLPIAMEDVNGYYHFLVGVLNSESGGDRSFAPLYGYSEILPGRMTTDKIVSQDGETYFDLLQGIIGGRIKFVSTAGETDLANWATGASRDIQAAQSAANAADQKAQQAINNAQAAVTDYNAKFAQVQSQIDGEVSNWFYNYSPTLTNYPASDWNTNAEKDRHVGDTFTNTSPSPATDAGKSWRFVKNGSAYSWTLIADSDAVKALQQAARAQSTADGKSTTYLVQPTKYALGDTWVLGADTTINGTAYKAGEILTATQDSATYNAAHWIKRVRYTDDSAVDGLQIGGRNLLLNSKRDLTGTSYAVAHFTASRDFVVGEELTVVIKGAIQGNKLFGLWFNAASIGTDAIPRVREGVYSKNLIVPNGTKNRIIGLYLIGNQSAGDSWEFESIMLASGNKSIEWIEAPEDIQAKIDAAQTYEEYSVNGTSGWHYPFASSDIFMRRKIGLNGAWGAPVRIVGEKGATGNAGKYTDFQFAKNTSATNAPTSGWQDAPPTLNAGEYLWMREGVVTPPATAPALWAVVRLSGEQGIQGIPGVKGADGTTHYTWIKYADTPTSGISQYPSGKKYIGFAYNKPTAAESSNYSDYSWSLIQGEQGQPGARGTDGTQYYNWVKYADTPTSGMSDNPAGKAYMGIAVNKTTATESTNYNDYTWQLTKGETGAKGDKGDTGARGLQGLQGAKGDTGIKGDKGNDGLSSYTHIAYADNASGGGFSQNPAGKAYIGMYVDNVAADSTTASKYKWSLIKGADGSQGVPGAQGADGRTPYLHIAYATNANGSSGFSTTDSTNKTHIGTYTDFAQADSTDPSKYKWSLIKGADGADGRSVTAVDVEFAQSTSATNAPASGWQTNPPAWVDGRYIWSRTKTTYSTGSPTYSTPANITGGKGNTGSTGGTGATGTGVDSITEEYYLSTSKTSQTGGAWWATPPTWVYGKYVWTRVKIVYKNPASTVYTTPVVSSEWEAVNNLQIGGRNLLLNSKRDLTGTSYAVAHFTASRDFVVGEELTVVIKGAIQGNKLFGLWFNAASIGTDAIPRVREGVYSKNLIVPNGTKNRIIGLYLIGNQSAGDSWEFESIMLASGNKSIEWIEAPEDIQGKIDGAMQVARETAYLKEAFAQTTEVNGGLVLGATLAVRNAANKVRAYLNGLASKAYAFAAGVENFASTNAAEPETQKTWLDHEGNAKIGNLRVGVDGDGSVWIEDKQGVTRVELSVKDLPTLQSLTSGSEIVRNANNAEKAARQTETYTFPNAISVVRDGSEVTVTGSIEAEASTLVPDSSCIMRVTCTLIKSSGEYYAYLGSATANAYKLPPQYASSGNVHIPPMPESPTALASMRIDAKLQSVPAGDYRIRAVFEKAERGVTAGAVGRVRATAMQSRYRLDKRAILIGKDGISAFFSAGKYVHIKDNSSGAPILEVGGGMRVKGDVKIPGVPIEVATFNQHGSVLYSMSGICQDATRVSEGKYRINLKYVAFSSHNDYLPEVTAHVSGVSPHYAQIYEWTYNYIEVWVADDYTTNDGGFMIKIYDRRP